MTALSTLWTLTQAPTSLQLATMAMLNVANSIFQDAYDPTLPTKYEKRHELAVLILRDPSTWATRFEFAVIALDQTGGIGTDALIIQATTTVFNNIAGIGSKDLIPLTQ